MPTELPLDGEFAAIHNNSGLFAPSGVGYYYHLTYAEVVVLPECGDFDQDRQNDLSDYQQFLDNYCHWICGGETCQCELPVVFDPLADFNEDEEVNLRDVAGFQRAFTGIPIVGDFGNNRSVNLFDFAHFHESYCDWPCVLSFFINDPQPPPCDDIYTYRTICDPPAVPHSRADIDNDADFYDFALFQNAFGNAE